MSPRREGLHGVGMVSALRGTGPQAAGAANGWWDNFGAISCCVAAYQPKGAVSLADSYTDLSGNGNNCSLGVAPGWAAGTGWTFNGINQYLDTGVTPVLDTTWSMAIQYANVTAQPPIKIIMGAFDAAGRGMYISPTTTGNPRSFRYGIAGAGVVDFLTGNAIIAGNPAYRNGVFNQNCASVTAWAPGSIYIGANNQTSAGISYPSDGDVSAAAIYDCVLTAPQVAILAAAMAAI